MYYPDDKDFSIFNAKLTDVLSKASEFEFNMPAKNQMYDALEERVTMIQILRNAEEIFYGEVREIKESLDKIKKVYCVGELAFLFDSTQPQARYQNVAPVQMLTEMLNIHNSKVEEKKRFYVGIVTVTDPNNSIYRYTNGEDTLTAIRKKLCEPLGGYLRVRKENGKRYLDLVPLEEYGVSAEQPIQFGRNLLKYNSKRSGANIATVCVPRGAKLDTQVVGGLDAYVDIKSVNGGKDYVINQAAYETYGWIEKIVEWKDVTKPENLLKKAQEWVNNNQYRVLALDLKAVDLAELNANLSPYKVGDMIHAIAEPFGMDMWFPLMKKVTYINDSITNDVTLSYQAQVTYTSQQNNNLQDMGNAIPQETDLLERARANATAILTAASQGYVYDIYDENGNRVEQLIMDTKDINTAQKVWRWNVNGFGYSKNGINGPFDTAITMDGAFVADMITSGILNANIIRAGIIRGVKGDTYWNLETGEIVLSGKFYQKSSNGNLAVGISNNTVDFYNFRNNGEIVGSIGMVTSGDDVGIEMYCEPDNDLTLGYVTKVGDNGARTIAPIFQINKDSYESNPPWIRNTVNGTLFAGHSGGGIKVKNGFIVDWGLDVASGTLEIPCGSYTAKILVQNGLISSWSFV